MVKAYGLLFLLIPMSVYCMDNGPLVKCCEAGNLEMVKYCVEVQKMDVNAKPIRFYSDPPLFVAIRRGHKKIVKYLIEHEACIGANEEGLSSCGTPFVRAAKYGQTHIMDMLISYGVDLSAEDEKVQGMIAYLCICLDQPDECCMLIRNSIRWMVEHGMDLYRCRQFNCSPLHRLSTASCGEAIELVDLLLSKDVPVDFIENGVTPLMRACESGAEEMAQFLLKNSANPNAVGPYTWTSLFYSKYLSTIKLLLRYGADLTVKNGEGQTIVHHHISGHSLKYHDNIRWMNVLMGQSSLNRPDINAQDKKGNTVLHYAAEWLGPELIPLLLFYGADSKIKNNENKTASEGALTDTIFNLLKDDCRDYEGHFNEYWCANTTREFGKRTILPYVARANETRVKREDKTVAHRNIALQLRNRECGARRIRERLYVEGQ